MIDCFLYDVMCQINIDWLLPTLVAGKQPPKRGNAHSFSSPSGIFRTKDKKYIFITQQTQKHWHILTEIIGRQDLNDLDLAERRDKHRD